MIIYLLFHTAAVQFLPDTILGSDIFSGMVDPHQVLTTICWATFLLFASLSFCHHFSFFTRPSRSSFYNMFPFPHLFSSLLSSSPTHLCLLSSLSLPVDSYVLQFAVCSRRREMDTFRSWTICLHLIFRVSLLLMIPWSYIVNEKKNYVCIYPY